MSKEQNEAGELQALGPVDDVYLDALLEFLDGAETREIGRASCRERV